MGLQRQEQILYAVSLALDLFHLIHDLHGGPLGHGNDVVQLVLGVLDLFSRLIQLHPFHPPVFQGNFPHGRAEALCQHTDIIKYISGNLFVVIFSVHPTNLPAKIHGLRFRLRRGQAGYGGLFLGQDMPHHLGGSGFRAAQNGDVVHHRVCGYSEKSSTYLKIDFRLSRCGHAQPPAAVFCLFPACSLPGLCRAYFFPIGNVPVFLNIL